ncbi:MAG: ArsA-related P-loop ATPase, partial [Plesiomonas shigelloides]
DVADDPLAHAVWQREQRALQTMPAQLAALPTDHVPLLATNLVGIDSLRQLLAGCALASESTTVSLVSESHPSLSALVDELAADEHGLIMLMGKGGVGKTTLAAAVAVALAQRGLPVHLTTSDPAAHLSETLAGELPTLEVSRIDPLVETARYRAQVLATKGASLDEQGRALLEEDLRSPCTEEIAVFQAFSRIIRDAGKRFVVMDTAPTGQTLLLLDATGAYHREIARQMGGKGLHFTTPMMQLQDPKQTKVMIVTLPEPTPVQEAANLQADLRRAGIEPWAWIVNHALQTEQVRSPLLVQRAHRQQPHIDAVKHLHAHRYAVVPLLASEPVGVAALQALSQVSTDSCKP